MEYTKLGVTVDTVIFTIKDNELKVLLIKRSIEPFKGSWALPGGFVREKENLDQAANRELEEETGLKLTSEVTYFISNKTLRESFIGFNGLSYSGPNIIVSSLVI